MRMISNILATVNDVGSVTEMFDWFFEKFAAFSVLQLIVFTGIVLTLVPIFFKFYLAKHYGVFNIRRKQIFHIEEYLKLKLTDKMRDDLEYEMEQRVWIDVFGFKLTKKQRTFFEPIIQSEDCPIEWRDVQSVLPYVREKNGDLGLGITKFRYQINYYGSVAVGLLFFGFFIFSLMIVVSGSIFGAQVDMGLRIVFVIYSLLLGLTSFVVYSAVRDFLIAVKLEKYLKSENLQNSSESTAK